MDTEANIKFQGHFDSNLIDWQYRIGYQCVCFPSRIH